MIRIILLCIILLSFNNCVPTIAEVSAYNCSRLVYLNKSYVKRVNSLTKQKHAGHKIDQKELDRTIARQKQLSEQYKECISYE